MDKKRNKIIDIIIKVILIIIIIILLIHDCMLNNNSKKKEKVPTGNVDIILINCEDKNVCKREKEDKKDDNKSNNDSNSNNKTIPTNSETDITTDEKITVLDSDIVWDGNIQARIFTNSMYKLEDVIAPESSNTYQFVVKNGTNINLKYNINFIENNPYNINMKYKLKKNDTYIVDHYVSPSEISIKDYLLKGNENDTYYLEWKWISSDNDTKVGKTPNANYELKIEVKAESTNE